MIKNFRAITFQLWQVSARQAKSALLFVAHRPGNILKDPFTKTGFSAKIVSMKRLSILLTILAFAVIGLRGQQRPLLTDDVDITPAGALDLAIGIDFFQDAKFRYDLGQWFAFFLWL